MIVFPFGMDILYFSSVDSVVKLWRLGLRELSPHIVFADSSKQITVSAGSNVTVNFTAQNQIGVDSGYIVIHFDTVALSLKSLQLPPSWVIVDSSTSNGTLDLHITADSSATLPSPIITLTFNTYLSTPSAKVYLDSANLYGKRITFDCQALSNASADSVEIDFDGCGDSTLLALMNHAAPFSIESIQPNPAQNEITVTLSGAAQPTVEMYDALGRAQDVRSTSLPSGVVLDVSGVPSGSYILRVSDGEYVQSRRVVIQH